jgi:hypothetical protein
MAEVEREYVEGRGPAGWALEALRRVVAMPVAEIRALVDDRISIQARDHRGRTLYIGTEIFWDNEPGCEVRAIAEVFANRNGTSYPLLTDSVIVAPDGALIGEEARLSDPAETYALLAAEIDALYALSWEELRARLGMPGSDRPRPVTAQSGRAHEVTTWATSFKPELGVSVTVRELGVAESAIDNDIRLTRAVVDDDE